MEEKIKEALKKTESIVNGAQINSEFKHAAFQEVFRVLLKNESQLKGESFALNTKEENIFLRKIRKAKPAFRSSISPAKLIDELIEKNFFAEKRRDIDCMKELSITKGIKIPRKQIATVLVRKLRSGSLKREKTEEGYVYFTK